MRDFGSRLQAKVKAETIKYNPLRQSAPVSCFQAEEGIASNRMLKRPFRYRFFEISANIFRAATVRER
jgi:hypothetical protein